MSAALGVIDDLSRPEPWARCGAAWELIVDGVMGGRSTATMRRATVAGRPAVRLEGVVSLENNGGFVQLALDLRGDGGTVDAGAWTGIALDVVGNDETYNLHLRTKDVVRPWQSYRASFRAPPSWTTVHLPFAAFTAHRLDAPFAVRRLRRLGIVAIGRAFTADVAVGGVRFYGAS
ncbi:MAG: CIA30 family protein [Alphaproteobacteria bacterium]